MHCNHTSRSHKAAGEAPHRGDPPDRPARSAPARRPEPVPTVVRCDTTLDRNHRGPGRVCARIVHPRPGRNHKPISASSTTLNQRSTGTSSSALSPNLAAYAGSSNLTSRSPLQPTPALAIAPVLRPARPPQADPGTLRTPRGHTFARCESPESNAEPRPIDRGLHQSVVLSLPVRVQVKAITQVLDAADPMPRLARLHQS